VTSFEFDSPVDVLTLLRVLAAHEVEFVVIGGFAVARYGYVRATKDLDIVPSPKRQNLERLLRALVQLEATQIEIGDFRREELPLELTAENLALGGNWALSTGSGRLDVMQFIEGVLETEEDYERLYREGVDSRFEFGTVRFVGYKDLVDLKLLAGREGDLIDVRAIREARRDTAR
jgi:hypothetical protein